MTQRNYTAEQLDICLVEMPYSSYAAPVYSLSLLKGELNRAGLKSKIFYGNMLFRHYIGLRDYLFGLFGGSQTMLFGEAIFASAAHRDTVAADIYNKRLREGNYSFFDEEQMARLLTNPSYYQRLIPSFIEELGEKILAHRPKLVGLASMFFQNNACLALARYLKSRRPEIIIVMGGANCLGSAGWAMVREFDFIDVVFSGEADECFAQMCRTLMEDGVEGKLPYGAMKRSMNLPEGLDFRAYPVRQTKDMDKIAFPDYDDYFAQLEEYGLKPEMQISLMAEFSRGCWWNAIKPCTFCGLNPLNNGYRKKSVPRIIEEMTYLHRRYGIERFELTDNIMAPEHLRDLLPEFIRLRKEENMYFYFFAEIKSNIKREQLKLLHDAGFVVLQPGIESISDGVLQVMNKGNRGIRHVELLRNLFELGITVIWHMLGGFPGEKNEYFQELADLIPLVHHLAPPGQFINILFVRYNEYWLHQEKHGIHLRPGDYYYLVYPGKEKFIRDSAFMFRHVEDDRHKMQENIILRSPEHKLVAERFSIWAKHWKISAPRFNFSDDGRKLELMDMRSCAVKLMDTLTGLERSVCLGCREVVKKERLLQKMAEEYTVKPDEVAAVVEKLVGLKYILEIRDELLFLPTLLNSAKHPTVEQRAMTIYYSMIRDGV